MNLFLAPASRANIDKSISTCVVLPEGSLAPSQLSKIKDAYGDNKAFHCFAMTENSRGTFKQMHPDDIVLFSIKSTGKFNYKGTVVLSIECPKEFGDALWEFTPNDPWTLVYFLKGVTQIDIKKVSLFERLDYKRGYPLPGVSCVKRNLVKGLTDRYGTLTAAVEAIERGDSPPEKPR